MLLFKALNTDLGEAAGQTVAQVTPTVVPPSPSETKKVELEPDNEHIFRTALSSLGEGQEERATELLQEVLKSLQLKSKKTSAKDLKLKYACLKNLVVIHEKAGRLDEALEYGIQAMEIDSQEISLIFRLGRLWVKTTGFDFALTAFRSVLAMRPQHWPSLDALLRLTFAMGRFEECLSLCCSGLSLDRHYRAALFCLREMITMQPSLAKGLQKEIVDILENQQLRESVEKDEKFCNEVREFGEWVRSEIQKKCESLKPLPQPLIPFDGPLDSTRWSSLLQVFRDKYFQLTDLGMLHMAVEIRSLLPIETEPPPSQPVKMELEEEGSELAPEANEEPVCVTSPPRPQTPDQPVALEAKVSPVDQIAKIVRQGVDETLVEKRRSSRACVVSAWAANDSELAGRKRGESENDSVISLLSGLLFEELWEWAQDTPAEILEMDEASQDTKDSHARSVDDDCEAEVLSFLNTLTTSSLMHHSRQLLLTLGEKYDRRWPRSMVKNYLALFEPVFGVNFQHEKLLAPTERIRFIHAYLLAMELQADRTQGELLAKNRLLHPHEEAFPRFPHLLMVHQWMLSHKQHEDSKAYKLAIIRIRWLDYMYQIMCGDRLMAEKTLKEVALLLDQEGLQHCNRPNCLQTPFIDSDVVIRALEALNKCVGVERLRALSQEQRYEDLIAAWEEDEGVRAAVSLSPVLCEARLLVHHALAFTQRLEEGLRHGIRSLHLTRGLLQDQECLDSSGLDPKSLLTFSWRSLRITAICWDSLSSDQREACSLSDLSRLAIAACMVIQELARCGNKLVNEEVWMLLHEVLAQLEKLEPSLCRSTATNRKEEVDLPPSLTSLSIGHEYLATNRCCDRSHGRFLRHILHASGHSERLRKEEYCGDPDDLEFLFLQALFCLHGITRKSKSRPVDDHHTNHLPLKDYPTMRIVYWHFHPDSVAEFDSVRSLSISADMMTMAKSIVNYLPRFEDHHGLSEAALEELITRDANDFQTFKDQWKKDSRNLISGDIYYLLADYHFKSRAVDEAVKLYRRDLRFNPLRFDSWAALSLARLSLVQSGLDQNLMTQDCSSMQDLVKEVNICMRGFDCALMLNNKCSKLMVENGTLAYEIYSYADKYYRKWKLHGPSISVPLLTACCSWRKEMLKVAERRFRGASGCAPEEEQELWYYCYMRGKCAEKANLPFFEEVIPRFRKSLALLHSAGARYPRRVFFYGAFPTLSLEAIEVFYRCHAALFKRLLRWSNCLEDCPELDRIEAELLELAKSEFAVADRVKSGHKRGRQKSAAPSVVPPATATGQRRSKRARVEAEESAPTSEAEGEEAPGPNETPDPGCSEALCAAQAAVEAVWSGLELQLDVRECLQTLIERSVTAVGHEAIDAETRTSLQWQRCLRLCLDAFELVVQRCPHHYKSVRQVARICLCLQPTRNIPKALEYLWTGGSSDGNKSAVCALFKDRKGNNLFNGIYRNPIHDLDRCGNFSYHMRSCVDLLVRALRERCDWDSLMEVCVTLLASIPEVKNVCMTGAELEILQKRAFVFCLRAIEQQLLRPETIEWPQESEIWLGHARLDPLPLFKLYRVFRIAESSFPQCKTEAFKLLAKAFFRTGVQISEGVPVINQIRTFLRVDA